MISLYFALYRHIVYVHLNILAQLGVKHFGHHSFVGGPCIFQSKGHYFVMVIPNERKECNLFLIVQS